MLKLNKTCDSAAEAQAMAKAALFKQNHGNMSVSFSLPGNPSICASQVVALSGLGQFDGNYYIDKITHTLSGSGYTCQYECSNVNNENSSEQEKKSGGGGQGSSTRQERLDAVLQGTRYSNNGANRNMVSEK